MTESTDNPRVAVLFPGQGSQYIGMADPWMAHPAGKEILARASDVLGWDVAERSHDPDALARSEVVQLALFACDLAASAVPLDDGVEVEADPGHYLGEDDRLGASGAS